MRIASLFQPKIREGFKLRRKQNGIYPWLKWEEKQKPIWIHCASGEFEYAKPVIREIKQQLPNQKILVTFFSPSVVFSLQKNKDVDFFCPLPWDKKKLFEQFIDFHEPKALLIARTDLWPAMINTCKKKKIPSLLFSKTVNKNKKGFSRRIESNLLKKLNAIFCASEEDREILSRQLKKYKTLYNAGDTRYDQVLHRIQHPNPLKPLNNFNRPIFIGGSTWPSDEDVLIPFIKKNKSEISFILAPHETNSKHLTKLAKKLRDKDIRFCWYSQTTSWDPMSVLIIDQVGILADLYKWAQYSFIGGSMDRNVHSVMESLAQGCLTFVGPNHHNNREALSFKQMQIEGISPVQEILSQDELLNKFQQLQPQWTSKNQELLKRELKDKSGGSSIVLKWLKKNML